MGNKVAIIGMTGVPSATLEQYKTNIEAAIKGAEVEIISVPVLPEDELIEKLQGFDILMSGFQPMTEKAYKETNLKAYCACSIGVDFTNAPIAKKYGVIVTNNPAYCIDEVAEHTVALMLEMARGLYKMIPYIKEGNWGFQCLKPLNRFKGSTIGFMGLGRIPRAAIKKLQGFEVNIIAYDPYVKQEDVIDLNVKMVDFNELIEKSDFISIHAPLTKTTEGIFNKNVFEKMKDSAYIINSARGQLINQEDLYEALINNQIKGAALDVLSKEPPQEMEKKLIALPNVVATSHSGFYSDQSMQVQTILTCEEIVRILKDEKPKHQVN